MTVSDSTPNVQQAQPAPLADPLPYTPVFLKSSASPAWLHELHARCTPLFRHVATLENPSRYTALRGRADALIAAPEPRALALFRELLADSSPARPLLVLVSPDEADERLADLVLPPSARLVRAQMATALRLRADCMRLEERNRALEGELEQERATVAGNRRAVDEAILLKESIISNVTHELRTPLLHIKSAVWLMADENPQSKYIDYAKTATTRLEMVVQNLAQLASSLTISVSAILIRDVLEQAERYLKRSWQRSHDVERVRFALEPHLPPVLGDRQGLVTVVQLLLDNALKFSQEPVDVRAFRDGDTVGVVVRDYGIGIPPGELPRIYDMFYQVDSSSTRHYAGSGIGLAIVKSILDKHGVPIHVSSEVNQGTAFSFRLPLAEMPA